MGKSITFISEVNGSSVSKTKKRMRGDTNSKPEIKIYDPCINTSGFATRGAVCTWLRNVPIEQQSNSLLYNHTPYRLRYPAVGTGSENMIGSSIFLKYLRLKGYIHSKCYVPVGVHWRLVLLKYNGPTNYSLDTSSYLSLFLGSTTNDPATWGVIGTVTNFNLTEEGTLMNYYMKIKDVERFDVFKRKVIASGYVPPSYVPLELHGTTTGVGETSEMTRYDLYTAADGDASNEFRFVQPLDVKVTLNDRINTTRYSSIYWLVFESDCGCGFKIDSVQDGRVVAETGYTDGTPVNLVFGTRAYFTDA